MRSTRWIAAAMAVGIAVLAATPGAAKRLDEQDSAPAPPSSPQAQAVVAAATAFDKHDFATALRLTKALIADPAFVALNEPLRAAVYQMAAYCTLEAGDVAAASGYALAGTRLAGASDSLWSLHLALTMQTRHDDEAVATTEAMARDHAAALNAVPILWFYQLSRMLRTSGDKSAQRRLLTVLTSSAYQPVHVSPTVDGFRLALAGLLYDAGDKPGAAAVVAAVQQARVLRQLSLDPRFRSMLPAGFDSRAAVEKELSAWQETARKRPELLGPIVEAGLRLRELGRAQEALDLLQAAAPAGPKARHYNDGVEQLNWWWNAVSKAHAALGHYDEAVAALRQGIQAGENGHANVSQMLNLAELQVRFGRGRDALATVAAFDASKAGASPYGDMVRAYDHGCAAIIAGKPADARADIARMKAQPIDNSQGLPGLLLCANDLDGAAAAYAKLLDDPEKRVDALTELSDYDPPIVALPPDPAESKLPALKARADVKAAITRAGGIRRFRIQN